MSAGGAGGPLCRGCRSSGLEPVLDLGLQPAAATFPAREELALQEPRWPLRTWICPRCWLMQLDDEGPEERSDTVPAIPSWSGTMERHARAYVAEVLARLAAGGRADRVRAPWRIVETASHGNYLQEFFRGQGTSTLIAEGSSAWADAAAAQDLSVERAPLERDTAPVLANRLGGAADSVVDYYLLAHLRGPDAFLSGIRAVLGPAGIAALEFDHVLPIIEERQFDAIRHGHFSYWSLLSLEAALGRTGLRVFDVEELPVYGGAVRAWLAPALAGSQRATPSVEALRVKEHDARLDRLETYRGYRSLVERAQQGLRAFLEAARRDGRSVVGYGAPSRGNTLLNSCGITSELLPATVDRSSTKQGRYLPGSHIPVHPPAYLLEARPDFVLVLAWDLVDEIRAQLPEVRSWGGRFVVPVPEVTVLP